MRAALLISLLVAACTPPPREAPRAEPTLANDAGAPPTNDASVGSTETDASASPVDAKAPVDAAEAKASAPSACPATKVDATGACVMAKPAQVCSFADAVCTCEPGRYCGGAVPPPHVLAAAQKPRWVCRPPPGSVRPDGCPANQPSGKCSAPGKTCQYSDCCAFTYRCQGGTWQRVGVSCPP